jgi:hypothetical protein
MRPLAVSRCDVRARHARQQRQAEIAATPAFLLFAGWLGLTILLSFDPSTSIRRLTLSACVVARSRRRCAIGEIPA